VFEETGINCEDLGYTIADLDITNYYDIRKDWRHRYESGSITNTEYVFYLKVETDTAITLDPNEHTDFVWLDFKTAHTRFYSKTNKEAAELIYKNQSCKL
jgi:dATP pyrophosphohydrolase